MKASLHSRSVMSAEPRRVVPEDSQCTALTRTHSPNQLLMSGTPQERLNRRRSKDRSLGACPSCMSGTPCGWLTNEHVDHTVGARPDCEGMATRRRLTDEQRDRSAGAYPSKLGSHSTPTLGRPAREARSMSEKSFLQYRQNRSSVKANHGSGGLQILRVRTCSRVFPPISRTDRSVARTLFRTFLPSPHRPAHHRLSRAGLTKMARPSTGQNSRPNLTRRESRWSQPATRGDRL